MTILGPNGAPVVDDSPRVRACLALVCTVCQEPAHSVPSFEVTLAQLAAVAQHGLPPPEWHCKCTGPTKAQFGYRVLEVIKPATDTTSPPLSSETPQ